jgi:hypothetical protein
MPDTRDIVHDSLTTEFAFCTDFKTDTGDFARERPQPYDHAINRVFQIQNFATSLDGDFLAEVAERHSCSHLCNTPDLVREIRREIVDNCRKFSPGSVDVEYDCLTAEFAFGSNLLRYTCDLARELGETIDHGVDDVLELDHDHALYGDRDLLGQVAGSDGLTDARDIADLCFQQGEFFRG